MKKIFFILFLFVSLLSAKNIQYYLYTINMNYNEYVSGANIDGDSAKFGKISGIGVLYTDYYHFLYFLKGEYAYGSSVYNGSTWGGVPLSVNKDNVYILTLQSGIFPVKNAPFYISAGYRLWNRGKSGYSGDYDEKYYWPFLGIGYHYVLAFNNFFIIPDIEYQYAYNPKLNVYLGSGTTLNLGVTTGEKAQLKFLYRYSDNIMLMLFYRYQSWYINKSASKNIVLDSKTYAIYEPSSTTKNQYLGLGVLIRF